MITINFLRPWTVRTPWVYRYLPAAYVDIFFETGELRLSSFAAFQKHKDEEREDKREGYNVLLHRTEQDGGQAVFIQMEVGQDSYVLCGSALASRDLMANFGCNSGIVIRDTTSFSNAVATQIPGFIGGLEGACSYSKMKLLMKDLGHLSIQPTDMPPKRAVELSPEIGQQIAQKLVTDDVYFTKEQKYSPQHEYRFIWRSASPISDFITVLVPDARKFCDRFTDFDA